MPLNHKNTKVHKRYLSIYDTVGTTCKESLPEEFGINEKKILEKFSVLVFSWQTNYEH